jgi:hypothetical protein
MHQLRGAHNRVYRAGLNTKRAANTKLLINQGNVQRTKSPTTLIWLKKRLLQQRGKRGDSCATTGRAAVKCLAFGGKRLCVRLAALIAALGALRLRQKVVQAFSKHGKARRFLGHRAGDLC